MGEFVHVYNDGGGIRNVQLLDGAVNLASPSTLFQSGVPFILFPGDGGSNGLSFSGTRGVFSLSAAPLTGISNILASGGYAYFPNGAGGLAEGWYLCKLTSDTAGEVYANTYVLGSGEPVIPDSPTTLANLTAGRITQSTSEITAVQVPVSATMFGKNDLIRVLGAIRATNSAGQKSLRFKMDTHVVGSILSTTSNNVVDMEFIRQNAGVLTRQLGTRTGTGWVGMAQTSLSQDHSMLNAAAAFNINMTLQLAVTTDFILGMARSINIVSRRS